MMAFLRRSPELGRAGDHSHQEAGFVIPRSGKPLLSRPCLSNGVTPKDWCHMTPRFLLRCSPPSERCQERLSPVQPCCCRTFPCSRKFLHLKKGPERPGLLHLRTWYFWDLAFGFLLG